MALQNQHFRNLFLTSFAQYNFNETKEMYAIQLHTIILSASDNFGFIYWSESKHIGVLVDNFSNNARKQIQVRNYKSAVFICTAIMEELIEALHHSDDSNGDIIGSIYTATEMLYNIAHENLPEEIRLIFIEYYFTALDKRIYSGWNWDIDVLRMVSLLIRTEKETERIYDLIEKFQKSDYEREQAQSIKYQILLKTKGDNIAEKFLEENITNSNLRRNAIQKAIDDKAFERVITITTDGINCDQKNKPGLALEWHDWVLKIAQPKTIQKKRIEYSRYLFIDNFMHAQDYYQILKNHVPQENWKIFVESIVHDIIAKKR